MLRPDEADLIRKAQEGDVEAFCILVAQYQKAMYALAFRFSGNHYDAEDLTQEVFIKAHRGIRQFRGTAAFQTWLRRIMVNAFLDHKRKSPTQPQAAPDAGTRLAGFGSDRAAYNNLVVHEVLERLNSVPPRQRLMFIMKHQEGMTCEEIADHFGTTVGTVKKTLFRVVQQLRMYFRPRTTVIREASNARLPEIP